MNHFSKATVCAIFIAFFLQITHVFAQKKYNYESVDGDHLNVRIYTLDNGLKIYTSVYKDEPRIQTSIAVRTGAKHDPADNTGLSHYLEHLMFKGSESFGSLDYETEKYYLKKIDSLFEVYRVLTNEKQRRDTYRIIDSISAIAAQYAIPNEYDKLLSAIGAKGTNAYTAVEQTVYINDIPSNQFAKWLDIEYERFSRPVFRLFHTELETVYEEKNMAMDNDGRNQMEALMNGLYPTHPYGTQTTLGDPEHLKNPSLLSLKEYYNSRYVPNNMAIILSGDFDPDEVVAMIDATFGKLEPVALTAYEFRKLPDIKSPVIKEVVGPDAESLRIGFRFQGVKSDDTYKLLFVDNILNNRMAGLIDLNLVQAQKVLSAGSFVYLKEDYSAHIFAGTPKEGQTLEEVKNLILGQIELLKKGEFPDWYMEAIINDYKLSEIREMESNRARNSVMVNAFVQNLDWKDRVSRIERMSKITKKDVIEFVNRHYRDNHVIVYKRTGPKAHVHKIDKPHITPLSINRDAQSEFFKEMISRDVAPIEPVFLDYEKDLKKFRTQNGVEVLYKKNEESPTSSLYFIFEMGNNHNPKLGLAIDYMSYLGTSKMSPAEVLMAFYRTGCTFRASCSDEQTVIIISGLSENIREALSIYSQLIADAQPNPAALKNMVEDLIKKRANDKLAKNTILWGGMLNYGMFGKNSPFTNIIPEKELKSIKPEELTEIIKSLNKYQHKVLYYGTHSPNELEKLLVTNQKSKRELKELPAEKIFTEQPNTKTKVYVVDYDMKQVDIMMLSKSENFSVEIIPEVNMFNEYFGRGMSSVVFQEMREAKGLAYTAFANFRTPSRPDRSHYIMTFIGTQSDKLPEATAGMYDLLNNMPESEKHFENAKEAIIEKIRTERITKASILFSYLRAQRMGINHDTRRDTYERTPQMTFKELKAFQEKYLKDKNYNILVLGNKASLNIDELKKYGEVIFLKLEDIFGY